MNPWRTMNLLRKIQIKWTFEWKYWKNFSFVFSLFCFVKSQLSALHSVLLEARIWSIFRNLFSTHAHSDPKSGQTFWSVAPLPVKQTKNSSECEWKGSVPLSTPPTTAKVCYITTTMKSKNWSRMEAAGVKDEDHNSSFWEYFQKI